MDGMKLVIADGTEEFRLALSEALRGAYRVRCCGEGREALELICSFRPELVLLDMMLPGMDGITILERCLEADVRPMVLATTRFQNEYVLSRLGELGVAYVMSKPCDLRGTISRLSDLRLRICQSTAVRPDPRTHICNLLIALGFRTKLDGYRCMVEAVLLESRNRGQSITKELYPAVGLLCDCNSNNVERNLRSSIEAAWKVGDPKLWQLYFPDHTRRPSNADFITRMADTLINEPEY